MIVAERTDTAIPIIETLTKFGLESGATLEAAIFDPRVGVTNPWLTDWSTGTWGAAKATETLTEDDPVDMPGRYIGHANMSAADAGSTHFIVFIEVTAGGQGGSQQTLMLVNELYDAADKTTADAILADTAVGGPGPWTTASGDPVIANPIIEAINAQTSLILAATQESNECPSTPILPVIYTGHKGDQLIVPVYRNGALMPDSELANGTQFSMTIRNITTDTAYNVTAVSFHATGHLVYTTKSADNIFETAGKWEYQADGLTEQGQPFESLRMTVRVYDDV